MAVDGEQCHHVYGGPCGGWRAWKEGCEGSRTGRMHSMAKLYTSRAFNARADRALLAAMQRRATVTAGEFDPQAVGNLLWALATMGERADRGPLEAMQRRATASAGQFKPQEVANVLWALAVMGERADRGLLEAMQKRATATAGDFSPQNVANVLWALATMGESVDRGLLEAMGRRATATADDFNSQHVANVLWALATMGESVDRGLLEAMQRRAAAVAGEFKPQGVANVLWALAVFGEKGHGTLEALIDRFAHRVLECRDQLSVEAKYQLHQWILSCELGLVAGASLPGGVARVKQEMGEECLQAFSGQAGRASQLQREVAAVLRRAVSEVEVKEEYRDDRSGYSIDALVRRWSAAGIPGGAKSLEEPAGDWAVEVDGPFHFLGDGRTPRGGTLLKRKQLGLLGYTVVAVPFWEWDTLKGEQAKRRYLEDKLGGGDAQRLAAGLWSGYV
ncbi:hypothetical protein T484DRAFT_1789163 [Baffinella frigidus]|nr:hypothetical protein T484DRAFT_1789163 [Cryptophyta sp. CCMP2293]